MAVKKRAVKKGLIKGNRLVIKAGLKKDDVIVTDNLSELSNEQLETKVIERTEGSKM